MWYVEEREQERERQQSRERLSKEEQERELVKSYCNSREWVWGAQKFDIYCAHPLQGLLQSLNCSTRGAVTI